MLITYDADSVIVTLLLFLCVRVCVLLRKVPYNKEVEIIAKSKDNTE